MLNYEKLSPEWDFPLTFDNQKKWTEWWPFSKKKKKKKIKTYTYDIYYGEEIPALRFLDFFQN